MGSAGARRYTSGMKIAVLLSRHRRLLALCGLSAAAHLLVLALVAQRAAAPMPAPRTGDALRLRLAPPAQGPAAAAHETPRPAPPPVPPPVPRPLPAPRPEPAPALAAAPGSPAPAEAPGAPLIQMPGRYRVRMPDAVRLSYALDRQAPGAPAATPAGGATLDWRSDGERYALALDGGVLGALRSEGGSGDAGIAPRRYGAERNGGVMLRDFDDGGAEGAQDPASVLMQLAGIGLAEPDQIAGQAGNEIRIVVAGDGGAEIARYQVIGQEEVQTPLGALAAWRLAQVAPPGRDRLELWLAPDHGWLPVRLRLTRADGGAVTQTLARIEAGEPR
jgi:Protein of unknown function (DUF3108)